MANFHPRLYSWLCKNYAAQPEKARKLTDLLTMCSLIENSNYPVNAKCALQKMGVPKTLHSRRVDWKRLTVAQRMEAEQLIRLSAEVEDELGIAR